MEEDIKVSEGTKISLSRIQEKLKPKNLANGTFSLLERRGEWFLIFLMLIVTAYCCYIWYKYVYHNEWSAAKKQEYIDSKEKGVTFQKNKFEGLILEKEERAKRFHEDLRNIPDIFRIKR